MAITGWIVDNSAAQRADDPVVGPQLEELAGDLRLCRIGRLEQLYSSRSGTDYDAHRDRLDAGFPIVEAPADVLQRAEQLQRELAQHHGMWHRTPIPDLLIAVTALHHNLGVVHVDADYERIAELRPLTVRRLG